MLQKILNLKGAQPLSKNEQKSIVGGNPFEDHHPHCTNPWQGAYTTSGECETNCLGSGAQCAQIVQGSQTCWVCVGGNEK